MKLLVLDFDFFFPNKLMTHADGTVPTDAYLFDWGHSEQNLAIQPALWQIRASEFLRHDLPLPALSGEEASFWSRLSIKKSATLYYADSNSQAARAEVARKVDELWLFDAHHDSGYQGKDTLKKITRSHSFDCENWMLQYAWKGADLHMRYPRWREDAFAAEPAPYLGPSDLDRAFDDGTTPPVTFDRIFICRSGAWVPSWHDATFQHLLDTAPVARLHDLTKDTAPRPFDIANAKLMADQMKTLMAKHQPSAPAQQRQL